MDVVFSVHMLSSPRREARRIERRGRRKRGVGSGFDVQGLG